MREYILRLTKIVLFLFILITSLYFINQVLIPKYIYKNSTWPTTSSYYQFYNMDINSVDVIFLGSSVIVNAFSPQEIYNNYGIRSYNLGSEQQSIFLSYYWLKEALRYQSPKVVLLDTRFLFEVHPESPVNTTEGLIRKCLDPMRWSSVKVEAVKELCEIDKDQSELSYYFTNIRFHSRWTSLTEYDFISSEYQYAELKGYAAIDTYGGDSFNVYTFGGDLEEKVNPQVVMKEYLDRIVELCKSKNIDLILMSLPGNSMNDGINNMLTSYAKVNKISYYNLCEKGLYHSIGAKLPKESIVDHGNIWGSMKLSQFIGELLKESYSVQAVKDVQYEKTREYYNHIIKNCELKHIIDIDEYLSEINDKNYTIFIAAKEECTQGLTESVKEKLKNLGLQQDLEGKYAWSYCAVIDPENGVIERLSDDKVSLVGSIRGGRTFYAISSAGYLAGVNSSIVIDGTEYSKNQRGLNIVVYDNMQMKIIDQVCFDTWKDCSAKR